MISFVFSFIVLFLIKLRCKSNFSISISIRQKYGNNILGLFRKLENTSKSIQNANRILIFYTAVNLAECSLGSCISII